MPSTNHTTNISHTIYQQLRHEISTLSLAPGTKLSEVRLAKKFNCSRVPVREALHLLAAEGAVELKPQRGSFVTYIDFDQLEKVRYLREALESKVIQDGFRQGCFEAIIPYLNALIDRQQEVLNAGAFETAYQLDLEFHRIFYNLANKEFVLQHAGDKDIHYLRARLLCLQLETPPVMPAQHRAIVNAIQNRDEQALMEALSLHLNNVTSLFDRKADNLSQYLLPPSPPKD